MAALVVAVAADELAVDAALMDFRLRWWLQWQQIDERQQMESCGWVQLGSCSRIWQQMVEAAV